jgi:hypothetical protein
MLHGLQLIQHKKLKWQTATATAFRARANYTVLGGVHCVFETF